MTGIRSFRPAMAALAVGLAACAGTPPPNAEVAVAESMLSQARGAGAPQYAPVEFASAREKLERAQAAMREEEYELARRLAEQAEADARLATTRSHSSRARQSLAEVQRGVQTLQQELLQQKQN